MSDTPHTHRLDAVSIFATLPAATLAELAAKSRLRRFPRRQVLCSEGDPGDELLVLEEGSAKVCRFAANGREVVLATVAAPVAFGELALFDDEPRAATLIATSDVAIRYIARGQVMALLERDPRVALGLLRRMAAMVRATDERLADVLALDVPGRLAKWLLANGKARGEVTPGQSQEALALSLGTTRVTLNRTLRRFARLGWIELRGDTIHLRDVPSLEVVARG